VWGVVCGAVKWIMICGGVAFWGSLVLESRLLQLGLSSPEFVKELLELEEKEDRRQAAFYGLEALFDYPALPDIAYFDAVRRRHPPHTHHHHHHHHDHCQHALQ
jgi:hypothetical protein